MEQIYTFANNVVAKKILYNNKYIYFGSRLKVTEKGTPLYEIKDTRLVPRGFVNMFPCDIVVEKGTNIFFSHLGRTFHCDQEHEFNVYPFFYEEDIVDGEIPLLKKFPQFSTYIKECSLQSCLLKVKTLFIPLEGSLDKRTKTKLLANPKYYQKMLASLMFEDYIPPKTTKSRYISVAGETSDIDLNEEQPKFNNIRIVDWDQIGNLLIYVLEKPYFPPVDEKPIHKVYLAKDIDLLANEVKHIFANYIAEIITVMKEEVDIMAETLGHILQKLNLENVSLVSPLTLYHHDISHQTKNITKYLNI